MSWDWGNTGLLAGIATMIGGVFGYLLKRQKMAIDSRTATFETIRDDQEERIRYIIEQADARINTLEQKYKKLTDEYFRLRMEMVNLKTDNVALRERVRHLEDENTLLRERVQHLERENAALKEDKTDPNR